MAELNVFIAGKENTIAYLPVTVGNAGDSIDLIYGENGDRYTARFSDYYDTGFVNNSSTGRFGGHLDSPIAGTRYTLVDIPSSTKGGGVLTHIISSPSISGVDSLVELWITIDGVEYSLQYTMPATTNSTRLLVGGFLPIDSQGTNTYSTGFGGYVDEGFSVSATHNILTLTPAQSISEGIGFKFKESLKVEIRQSNIASFGDSYTTMGAAGLNSPIIAF